MARVRMVLAHVERRINPFIVPVCSWMRDFRTGNLMEITLLNPRVFDVPIRQDLMHRAVTWYRAGLRQGTASTKTRSEVSGSTRKAFPQNNRGKARVGSIRAPHFRGGGNCFGPKPRDWSWPIPQKVLKFAQRSALTTKYMQDELLIVSDSTFDLQADKTNHHKDCLKQCHEIINANKWKKCLWIDTLPLARDLTLGIKKFPEISFRQAGPLSTRKSLVYDLLNHPKVVMTRRAANYYSVLLEE